MVRTWFKESTRHSCHTSLLNHCQTFKEKVAERRSHQTWDLCFRALPKLYTLKNGISSGYQMIFGVSVLCALSSELVFMKLNGRRMHVDKPQLRDTMHLGTTYGV